MSESKQGEKNNRFGTTHSEETKEKIRKANQGKIKSKETRNKISKSKTKIILQLDINGTVIKEWFGGGKEIERELGYGYSSVMRWCKADKVYKEYYWKFK